MSREEWAKLSDEEKRIKVAELCGWMEANPCHMNGDVYRTWVLPDGTPSTLSALPDYLNNLNAIHEAEMEHCYAGPIFVKYARHLLEVCDGTGQPVHMATAAQRAEAFVLTMEDAA
jgi:hypothetical protein